MKKSEIMANNERVVEMWNAAIDAAPDHVNEREIKRLRHCSAYTYDAGDYVYLQSYSTVVAAYNKRDNVVIDVLRLVYGYTATSAQHISKFTHDCKAAEVLRYV